MKALKIIGFILAFLTFAGFVFWFGWLRAPSPEDVCEHMAEQRKFERDPLDSPLAEIVMRVGDAGSPAEVAAVADGLLRRLHGGANDYEVIVPEALLRVSAARLASEASLRPEVKPSHPSHDDSVRCMLTKIHDARPDVPHHRRHRADRHRFRP